MANSDALQELQNRLATRLEEVKSGSILASWLAVESGQGRFLLPLSQAGEIFAWTPAQPVPYTQPWFMGVCNLKGSLYGVVDLAAYLGLRPMVRRQEVARGDSRLVVFNAQAELNCALLIDRLAGLRGSDAFVLNEAPPPDAPACYGRVCTDLQGLQWQEISLQLLSQQPEFLSISV